MCEVTITQATAELPMLVKKLQTGEESVVYIKQDGRTVAQLTLSKTIGKQSLKWMCRNV